MLRIENAIQFTFYVRDLLLECQRKIIFLTRLVKIVISRCVLRWENGKFHNCSYFPHKWWKYSFSRFKTDGESTTHVGKNNVFHLWKTSDWQMLVFPTSKTNSYFSTRLVKIVLLPSVLRRKNGRFHNCCYFPLLVGKIDTFRLKTDGEITIFTRRVGKNNAFHLSGKSNWQLLVFPTSKTNS